MSNNENILPNKLININKLKFAQSTTHVSDDPGDSNKAHRELEQITRQKYRNALRLETIADEEILSTISTVFDNIKHTTYARMDVVGNYFIYNLRHMKSVYSCTAFKSTRTSDGSQTSCIYAYLYTKSGNMISGDASSILHRFIVCSPTFTSQDGEFRHRFISFDAFCKAREKHAQVVEIVEEYLVNAISSGEINLFAEVFMSKVAKITEDALLEDINVKRIAIYAWIACWLCDYYNFAISAIENHLHPGYLYNFLHESTRPMFDLIIKRVGKGEIEAAVQSFSKCSAEVDETSLFNRFEVGQKIIPLTVNEAFVENITNIRYSGWREIYICAKMSNLVLNFISPAFQMTGGWIFIQNSNASLFDNKSMYDKHDNSKTSRIITDQLMTADELTYVDRRRSRGTINSTFAAVSHKIAKTVHFTEDNLVLSDISVMINSEYLGRTWRDAPYVAEKVKNSIHNLMFSNHDAFKKMFFDFIYGFHCMNTKVGCMHGDFHTNNGTVYHNFKYISKNITIDETAPSAGIERSGLAANLFKKGAPTQYYIINDGTWNDTHYDDNSLIQTGTVKKPAPAPVPFNAENMEIFVLPTIGMQACIIDYSRSIIGNYDMLVRDFGQNFADMFFKEQRESFRRIIFKYFPNIIEKYKDKLLVLLIDKPNLVFKIMCAVDTYSVAKNTLQILKSHPGIANKQNESFLMRLQILSERYILNNLENAIEKKITSVDEIPWPNLMFLRELFSEYRRVGKKEIIKNAINETIVDVFRYQNEVRYDIHNEKERAPVIDCKDYLAVMEKYNVPISPDWKLFFDEFNMTERNEIRAITSLTKYSRNDDFAKSSWLY